MSFQTFFFDFSISRFSFLGRLYACGFLIEPRLPGERTYVYLRSREYLRDAFSSLSDLSPLATSFAFSPAAYCGDPICRVGSLEYRRLRAAFFDKVF